MRPQGVRTGLLALALGFGLVMPALAVDRHVLLDTDGDGQLNDCPNPAHNAQGTSNTAEVQWCQGGSQAGRVIGIAAGRTSASGCTGGGGTLRALASGEIVDVDGDGSPEPVYGHPQACVYNMARSDSCDVHSGVYRRPGAFCDEDCGEGVALTPDVCERGDCWQATVVAYGQGPNLTNTGYGTAAAPGWLRGASSNGSVDTWDVNGNRIPDTEPGEPTGYPVIFSGDLDADGVFDTTTCAGGVCSGDAFYGVIVGCGGGGYGSGYCSTSMPAGYSYSKIDHDANGSMDRIYGQSPPSQSAADHFIVRDIEFQRYNGGNGTSGGARFREGLIALEGSNNSTDGIKVQHIYVHSNDYSLAASTESYWAVFSDSHNHQCVGHTEISESYIVQTNEKVLDDDCGPTSECGCPKSFHDNRVLTNITSPRRRASFAVFAYLKSIDAVQSGTRKKDHRFYNNEFIVQSAQTKFWDIQEFGDDGAANGPGLGQIWFYGNVVRDRTNGVKTLNRFWPVNCTGSVDNLYEVFFFNNTFDQVYDTGSDGLGMACSAVAERIVERNNAYYQPRFIHSTPAVAAVRSAEVCSTATSNPASCTVSATGRTTWFGPGGASGLFDGPLAFAPSATGPLAGRGSCDPDGDGVAGVDYDADGINDTNWLDLAGNIVSCPTPGSAIHIGAIQSDQSAFGSPPAAPSLTTSGVDVFTVTLTGSAFSDPDAEDTHAASQFQAAPLASGFSGPKLKDSGVLSGAITQWSPTGLLAGTAHLARARYRDSNGLWSPWSSNAAFTTLVDTVPPNAVQNLRRTDTP